MAPFRSVLGMAVMPAPIAFDRKGNTPSRNSCQTTQQRNTSPGAAARHAALPLAPKTRQTLRQVSAA